MKDKLIIIGLSSTAMHVFDFVTGYNLFDIQGFAVDANYIKEDKFCGLPVYDLEKLEDHFDMKQVKVFVALLWNRLNSDRKLLYERMKRKGYCFANIISPHAVIRGKLVGDNCWIHDYVVIQSKAEIGSDCMLMAFALVGDYTKMEDHCFMGTKSTIGGKSSIGEQTFIGINCTVFDETSVGKKCILGACTAVKRNVDDFTVIKTASDNNTVIQMKENTIEEKLLFKRNIR